MLSQMSAMTDWRWWWVAVDDWLSSFKYLQDKSRLKPSSLYRFFFLLTSPLMALVILMLVRVFDDTMYSDINFVFFYILLQCALALLLFVRPFKAPFEGRNHFGCVIVLLLVYDSLKVHYFLFFLSFSFFLSRNTLTAAFLYYIIDGPLRRFYAARQDISTFKHHLHMSNIKQGTEWNDEKKTMVWWGERERKIHSHPPLWFQGHSERKGVTFY